MPIPVMGSDIGKAYTKFKYWYSNGMFTVIYKNGLAFYFLNKPNSPNKGELKFVGRKNVNVKFGHRFNDRFSQSQSTMLSRGKAVFDNAISGIRRIK
jgi:hypothetical protein